MRAHFKFRLALDLEPGDYNRLPPWVREHTYYVATNEVVLYKEGEFEITDEPQTQLGAVAEAVNGVLRDMKGTLAALAGWVLTQRRSEHE